MHEDLILDGRVLAARWPISRTRPALVLLAAGLTALISMAVCALAILAHAPTMAVPMIAAIAVGCPMFAGWEVPGAVATLRADRARRMGGRALARFQRSLAQLPETDHPLGL